MNELTKRDWEKAALSQNAINAGALVKSLDEMMPRIRHDSANRGIDHAQHPIFTMFIAQLTFLNNFNNRSCFQASEECRRMKEQL